VHLLKYRRTVADGHGVKVAGTVVMDGELSVKSGGEGGVSGRERCKLGCCLVFADKGRFGGVKLDRGIIVNRLQGRVALWWLSAPLLGGASTLRALAGLTGGDDCGASLGRWRLQHGLEQALLTLQPWPHSGVPGP
jgi:hypothetical protein